MGPAIQSLLRHIVQHSATTRIARVEPSLFGNIFSCQYIVPLFAKILRGNDQSYLPVTGDAARPTVSARFFPAQLARRVGDLFFIVLCGHQEAIAYAYHPNSGMMSNGVTDWCAFVNQETSKRY